MREASEERVYRRSEAGLDLREPDVSEECLTSFGVASSYLIINS